MANINFGSWKTTIGGIAGLMVAIGTLGKVLNDWFLGNPLHYEELAIAIGAIGTTINGFFARDNNVTSEEAGAK